MAGVAANGIIDGTMNFWHDAIRSDGTKVMSRMIWRSLTANLFLEQQKFKRWRQPWQVLWPIHEQREK
jgi:hypothetical protein